MSRTRLASVLILIVVAACGSKQAGDDCQRFVDKSAPTLRGLAEAAGKKLDQKMLDDMAKDCRSKDMGKDKAMMECVLAAANQDAIAACWSEAFSDYRDAGRATEGELMVNRIGKGAKVAYITEAAFPVGTAPLTPDCCAQPGHKCKADPAVWTGVWEKLEFSIEEEHRFRYSYDGTAEGFTARAVGDLDCDGATIEITAKGTATDGNPAVEITKSGTD